MLSEVQLLQEYSYLRSLKNHEYSIAYLDVNSDPFDVDVAIRRIIDLDVKMEEVKRLINICRAGKWFPDKKEEY